jgi:glycosyltransferase involved in cell wall biosynthesis
VFTLPYPWRLQNEAISSSGDETHYLFLGRLIEAKGVTVLLKAWERLERRFGGEAPRLLIAGSGPLEQFVRSGVENLRTVEFVGQISGEAKRRALAGTRAVIAPSLWWEALGLIAYEAYDYGKPVLAAKSGGLQEIVFHEQTGLLHEPGNAEQLADQVVVMEERKQLRQQMGREGRQWLEKNITQEHWQRKFSGILEYATR